MMKLHRFTMVSRVFSGLLAVLFLLLLPGGCGFKTMPVAPQTVVPRAITDLRYQISEKGVTLFWSYPIETVSGDDLTDIANFMLYRAVIPADSYCETCPIPFGKPIILPGGALPGEGRKTGIYESTLLRPGNLYFFKIRSKTGWLAESADSNVISFIWQIPPMAPTDLKGEVKDSAVALTWKPVTVHIDGTPITRPVKYQVSRSLGGTAFTNIGVPIAATSLVDTSVSNGRKYIYRVQAVTVYDEGTVGGGFSENIVATPVDQIPPAPPVDVKAVHTASGNKIFWNPVEDSDLKGYRIYRRLSGATTAVKIGEVSEQFTLYNDQGFPENAVRLFYSVSSIDGSNPPNESVRSPEVMIVR